MQYIILYYINVLFADPNNILNINIINYILNMSYY